MHGESDFPFVNVIALLLNCSFDLDPYGWVIKLLNVLRTFVLVLNLSTFHVENAI